MVVKMKVGVDLAKEKLDIAIKLDSLDRIEFKTISWDSVKSFFTELHKKEPINYICIEWTGHLTLKFYQIVKDLGLENKLYVVSGHYTKEERRKYIQQKKTDKLDALILLNSYRDGEMGIINKFPDINEEIRRIRELVQMYDFITEDIARYKNIIKELENPILVEILDVLKNKRKELEEEIKKLINESKYKELTNIPGVSYITAAYIVAYVITIERFKNKKAFFAYLGVVKRTMKSGKYEINKRNIAFHRKLYKVLWMAVLGAIKSKKENKIKEMFYKQKSKGKHSFVARKHAMRILAYEIYKVMKKLG